MSVRREHRVAGRLDALLVAHPGADPERVGPLDAPIVPGAALTRRTAVRLFESALQSRAQDLVAREMKDRGDGFYTIGSSGHEANAVFGHLLRTTDPALLHYRSGAFLAARQRRAPGETPVFDAMLSFAAAADDPVSGGRHKVLGSSSLWVPPQTSTIASHLPKAVGIAYALARMERHGLPCPIPRDSIVYCSFGDASSNHATAQAGFTAAAASAMHRQPCPVLFVCEDNGIGISVRTPVDYIQRSFGSRAGMTWFAADGRDLAATYAQAGAAIEHCRRTRRPVFFHLRTVRLLGHAGSDVETVYRTPEELEEAEHQDPLLAFADLLLATGAITRDEMKRMRDDMLSRVRRAGVEASLRPKLRTAAEVTAPLRLPSPDSLPVRIAPEARRRAVFGDQLPEQEARGRHLAFRLSQALRDELAAYPEAFVFGEDVARKGGVYNVTAGLLEAFGSGRVFNTILDETTILGLAQGMAQVGCLPIPEIQYLAYVHNAIDQLRGEAASLQFFSNGRYANPMVVRIAGYGYQKGFGGHFHNDNSIGALLEIPGLVIASPARPEDAVGMLRTCLAAASKAGKVCVFLEPIALYMTKDLHEKGDGGWESPYPPPGECVPLGAPRLHGATPADRLTIVAWANGLYLSLRAQRRLAAEGIAARVLDLRWLAPLPHAAVAEHAAATGRVLVVDECRATAAGPSAAILAELAQNPATRGIAMRRIAAVDSYVPLGAAANLVMVQEDDIVAAARELVQLAPAGGGR
ncbi:MAG: MFS transporter [Planctomycetes bacterium]|nr:MFS transporter [Planctomycetota bacterium]